jgi:hypothetical protein
MVSCIFLLQIIHSLFSHYFYFLRLKWGMMVIRILVIWAESMNLGDSMGCGACAVTDSPWIIMTPGVPGRLRCWSRVD